MLYSQGILWKTWKSASRNSKIPANLAHFASHYIFSRTPTRIWLDFAFHQLFA